MGPLVLCSLEVSGALHVLIPAPHSAETHQGSRACVRPPCPFPCAAAHSKDWQFCLTKSSSLGLHSQHWEEMQGWNGCASQTCQHRKQPPPHSYPLQTECGDLFVPGPEPQPWGLNKPHIFPEAAAMVMEVSSPSRGPSWRWGCSRKPPLLF